MNITGVLRLILVAYSCFSQVAGFIFGGNIKEGKIDMTTPVQTEAESNSQDKGEKIAMTTPVATEMSGGR